jgi:hypothetical protein
MTISLVVQKLQAGLARWKEITESWPVTIRSLAIWTYIQVFQPILDANDGKRACWAIGAVNTAIWVFWQIPRYRPFMMKHFTHNPLSGLSYTIFTSMFRSVLRNITSEYSPLIRPLVTRASCICCLIAWLLRASVCAITWGCTVLINS